LSWYSLFYLPEDYLIQCIFNNKKDYYVKKKLNMLPEIGRNFGS
jgi:hypothetical protein